ncbi:hypothetical protein NDU88_006570 [Pleurodeles waltl]|uniref:Uncharacterized protein n=1 Tax=Pleurodeles waltl TaxID=8319 RepID=A0AAV7RQI2_PLEWA|nr:hypothetical protein NDU88_006570 [Pleurodeles waltl]
MTALVSYFDSVQLLWLEEGHCQFPDKPFMVEKAIQAISAMVGNKAPVLDGVTAAFYKEFAPILALHLLAMYE